MEQQETQQTQQPSFWAVLPAKIRYDKEVDFTSKVIFAEITALSNMWGYCSAGNQYFADRFDLSVTQISRIVAKLIDRHYIRSVIEKAKGNKRRLYPLIDNVGEEIIDTSKMTFEMMFDQAVGEVSEELKPEREKFIRKWTEKNDTGKKGIKERWQMEKTFSISGRWTTWKSNYEKWKKPAFVPRKSDTEIRAEAKRQAQEEAEKKAREEVCKPRTPEEQKQYDEKMAELRKNMQNLFNKKI